MRMFQRIVVVFGALVLPATVYAQASISGVVRDTSGAVLPGVTVEAASPVLIEKIRTTITDGNGRYELIDLRPGAYTVTFTLPGFNLFRREGVALSGSVGAVVDADLRVGAVQETVTVTGAAPTVDVTTTTRQAVLSTDTIDALPTSRNYVALARLIPAAVNNLTDVGGSNLQRVGGTVQIHGSRPQDQRITVNGVGTMTLQGSGAQGGQSPDVGSAAEVTIDHTGVSAELPTGGVRINFIPRDGGNRFADSTFFTFTNGGLAGTNFTEELQRAGLRTPNEIKRNWDLNAAAGGPIRRDSVWFWFSSRYNGTENWAPIFVNQNAYKPNEYLYVPDTSKRGLMKGQLYNSSLRVTWQASPRNKIAATYKQDKWCDCPDEISGVVAPEASRDFRFPVLRQVHGEWTSPVTNRLLFEAVGLHLYERWGRMHPESARGSNPEARGLAAPMISVREQSNGLLYRAPDLDLNNTRVPNFAYRAAISYVTGTHNVRVGFNRVHGFSETTNYNLNALAYQFNNGVPNQLTMRANPVKFINHVNNDLGIFAQDKWTLDRATINLALRYDNFNASFPEQRVGPAELAPNRSFVFPAEDNLNWNDLTYRSGLVYDVRGDGKTALKITFNKYLRGMGLGLNQLGSDPNPVNTMVTTANRAWTDSNRDFVPDCNLLDFAPNGECGRISNPLFGSARGSATFDDILRTGWGNRDTNWELAAGVQREILPGVSLDVGYFRRIWKNFRVTDDLALAATDFDAFNMTVPSDPRLPSGGGYRLDGLFALRPEAFGRAPQNQNTLDRTYGSQREHWNGVDVVLDARLPNGLALQAGTSTGRTMEDDCDVVSKVPEMLNVGFPPQGVVSVVPPAGTPFAWRPSGFCHRQTPWLTQFKTFGTYRIPRIDVQVSGTFRSIPGDFVRAAFVATNAYLAANSTLGRPLAGGVASMTIDLVEPYSISLDRRNELDLRVGKPLRAGGSRTVVSVDVFNLLNSNAVVNANQNFGAWLRPTQILNARVVKFSVQFDY